MAGKIGRGMAALLLTLAAGACAGLASPDAPPAPMPTPTWMAGGDWAQALVFTGDVAGSMDHVAPDSGPATSECTGRNSRPAGAWASTLLGPVAGDVYEVVVTVRPYHGPGEYRSPDVAVQVSRPDGTAVWETGAADSARFTVGTGEESGSVDATLTNLTTTTTTLHVQGRWSCRT